MPGYQVDVIDLGLKIGDAIEMGLEPEEFIRKKALPDKLELNEVEMKMFIGKNSYGWGKWYVCQRIELNAMSAPQLVAYIERKLEEAGAYPKVIPSDEALPELSDDIFQDELNRHIQEILDSILSVSQIQKEMARKFKMEHRMAQQWILKAFERDSSISWREALRQQFERHCSKNQKELYDAVRAKVGEALV